LKNWRIAVDLGTLVAQVSSQASDETEEHTGSDSLDQMGQLGCIRE